MSNGTLRLRLRQTSEEQSDKALDLEVFDKTKGEYPIDLSYTSGSQCFRIAVSLALAMGQYVSRSTKRIESVIIDEGFGGLDKSGRDSMIRQLEELSHQLKRIIVISHQEEFANAFIRNGFAKGYKISLQDGQTTMIPMH